MTWAPDYVTAAELASFIRAAPDAAEFGAVATAVSRAIDGYCRRQFGSTATAVDRVYRRPAYYSPAHAMWLLEIDDVSDSTGMSVGGVAIASSGATLLPDDAPLRGRPWERLGFTDAPTVPITVHATFGWTTVPTAVKQAAKMQGNRLAARRSSPFGVAGSPEQGSEIRLLSQLDVDVRALLGGGQYRRMARAA